MKKLILSAIIAMVAMTGVNAQEYKWWVGGRTAFWSSDIGTSFSFAPEVGYKLTPKLTLATSLAYQSFKYDDSDGLSPDISGLIFNPYVRLTVFNNGIVSGFIDGGMELGIGDYDGVQIGFKPGIAIQLSDRFTAVTQFGFVGYNDGKGVGGRREGFGYDLSGYCTSFGIYYSF